MHIIIIIIIIIIMRKRLAIVVPVRKLGARIDLRWDRSTQDVHDARGDRTEERDGTS